MVKGKYDDAIRILKEKLKTTRCSELIKMMTDLGYEVSKGSKGNHHTFIHPDDIDIRGSFDCGHGADSQVNFKYIKNVIKTMQKLKSNFVEGDDE